MVWTWGRPSQTEEAHQIGSVAPRPAFPGTAGSGVSPSSALVSRRFSATGPV